MRRLTVWQSRRSEIVRKIPGRNEKHCQPGIFLSEVGKECMENAVDKIRRVCRRVRILRNPPAALTDAAYVSAVAGEWQKKDAPVRNAAVFYRVVQNAPCVLRG